MHPGDGDHPGARRDGPCQLGRHLLRVGLARLRAERDSPDGRAAPRGTIVQRPVGGGMVVSGAEDFLTLAQRKPAVERAQAHGGAVGHGEVVGLAAEVLAGGGARGPLEAPDVVLGVAVRVFIEAAPVRVDGLLHRRRVRGEEEHRHVDPWGSRENCRRTCSQSERSAGALLATASWARHFASSGAAPSTAARARNPRRLMVSLPFSPCYARPSKGRECRYRARGAVMLFSWPAWSRRTAARPSSSVRRIRRKATRRRVAPNPAPRRSPTPP